MHLMLSKKGSGTYATASASKRVGRKVVKTDSVYLGKVIDLEKGIFESKERGIYTYNVETGEFGTADLSAVPTKSRGKRTCVADFGDIYLLDCFLKESGLYKCIDGSGCLNTDTMKALIAFSVLTKEPYSWAEDWYESSFASVLYPKADLDGRRISEFLKQIGEGDVHRTFFQNYLEMIIGQTPTAFMVDSTGAPNSVRMPITGINNHNGEISKEVRLVYVCRKSDRVPLYYRYVPGNLNDASTLERTIEELRCYDINPDYVILDAGYCTLENMKYLMKSSIGFITRLRPNYEIYKTIVKEHLADLTEDARTLHNDRFIRVVSKEMSFEGAPRKVWVHLMLDEDMKNNEEKSAFIRCREGKITEEEMKKINASAGIFVIVSTFWIEKDQVAPTYYERGGIEQLFDTGKTNGRVSKVAVHTEEVYNGKTLIDFIALTANRMLQIRMNEVGEKLAKRKRKHKDAIPGRNLSVNHALYILRGQKCDIFENKTLPRECTKRMNEAYTALDFTSPKSIDLGSKLL